MLKLQNIADNKPNIKLWLYPTLEYTVLHCNIDQNSIGLASGFPKASVEFFLDIWNQWT